MIESIEKKNFSYILFDFLCLKIWPFFGVIQAKLRKKWLKIFTYLQFCATDV